LPTRQTFGLCRIARRQSFAKALRCRTNPNTHFSTDNHGRHVLDGQTIVLIAHTAVPNNAPARNLRKEPADQKPGRVLSKTTSQQKTFVIFVTPRLIDPTGKPIHTGEEIAARMNSTSPQVLPRQK